MKRKLVDCDDQRTAQSSKKYKCSTSTVTLPEGVATKLGSGIVLIRNFLSNEEQLKILGDTIALGSVKDGFFEANNERYSH